MKNILTKREEEILVLIVQEITSADQAEKLHLSVRTIDTHRKNIMRKTKSKTLVGLVKFAIKTGLVEGYYFKKKFSEDSPRLKHT